jgi:RNA polymerase sigma factor (sigma-70 family)
MRRLIIKYALILFIALSALKFLEFQLFSHKIPFETYLIIVAVLFTVTGLVVSQFLSRWRLRERASLKSSDSNNIDEQAIDQQLLDSFSTREQQVLQLLCHGYTNKEIAKSLDISPNTVKTHLSKIFSKLGVSNRTQALSEAKLLNLIH